MTLIRPSFVEQLFHTMFQLEPDRPYYYLFVTRLARNIFLNLGFENEVFWMDALIRDVIENPLRGDFVSIMHAYYNPRFMMYKKAYTRVGDIIEGREITRYEMMMRLEYMKDRIYDRIVQLSPYIRFTKQYTALT